MLLMSGLSWQKVEVGFSNSNIRVYQTFPSLSDLHPHPFKLPSRTRTRLRKEIKENIKIVHFSKRKRRKEGQPVISWSGALQDNCFKLFFDTRKILSLLLYRPPSQLVCYEMSAPRSFFLDFREPPDFSRKAQHRFHFTHLGFSLKV